MARRAARADANQAEIVKELRGAGATVQHLHMVGGGCPDILVGFRNQNLIFEIKDGNKPPSARKLTEAEQKWHDEWRGTVSVVETVEQALTLIGCAYRIGEK